MLIHRQNAGPIDKVVGKIGINPYVSIPRRKLNITINGDAEGWAGAVIPERTLYNKLLDGIGKYAPRMMNGLISKQSNSTNFICDVPNALRAYLATGDLVRYYDASAEALSADSITIDAISAEDGGDLGTGYTKITCTGEVFTAAPLTGADYLVLSDGSEEDADMVLVDEEVDLSDSLDKVVSGSDGCVVKKSLINRTDFINKVALAGREFYVLNE